MQKITVPTEKAGLRLDKFLAQEFFAYSRSQIATWITQDGILVNQKKVKASQKLQVGDILSFEKLPEALSLQPNPQVKLELVFENQDFLVINKPANLTVHPLRITQADTVVNGLLAIHPELITLHEQGSLAQLRPGIVHRLDKETSGLLLLAKNQKTLQALKQLFQTHEIKKEYLATCIGQPKTSRGTITLPLAKTSTYRKQVVANNKTKTKVRSAITDFVVLKKIGDFSLLQLSPKTGRTHQLRIHLAALGCPLVGDKLYLPKNLRKKFGNLATRHLLHAKRLEFELFGQKYHFESEPPADFVDFLTQH